MNISNTYRSILCFSLLLLGSSIVLAKDAKVAGTDFHATGTIPCATVRGQPMGSCDFGVKRAGNGNATVTITRADGHHRMIVFKKGKAVSYGQNTTKPSPIKSTKKADLNFIQIGAERYEIPDIIIFGD